MPVLPPSVDDLTAATCLENVDRVSGDAATSAFKAAARLHQSRWRNARNLSIGAHPIRGGDGARPLGSRLPLALAVETGANFIDARCADAARTRLATPQRHQMLNADRLHADLLSSMPMCFNLFGPTPVGIKPARLPRYLEVSRRSGLFDGADLDAFARDTASQLWLDHLLALSMLQHPSNQWHWARFVVVYPDGNPSWLPLIAKYRALLRDDATFASATFDQLVEADALEPVVRLALRERYRCW